MVFVTGGAFQGKGEFARKTFRPVMVIEAEEVLPKALVRADCILNYHKAVRGQVKRGEDVLAAADRLLRENPDAVITMDEVGSGVVPMDAVERRYREQAGLAAAFFAREAKSVYRLVCGIAQKLK